MTDNGDAYTDVKLEGAGHLRVRVGDEGVTVDFVRAWMPKDTADGKHTNGEVAYTYTVKTRPTDVAEEIKPIDIQIAPNPATDILRVITPYEIAGAHTRIYDVLGTLVIDTDQEEIAVDELPRGMYTVVVEAAGVQRTSTMIIGKE